MPVNRQRCRCSTWHADQAVKRKLIALSTLLVTAFLLGCGQNETSGSVTPDQMKQHAKNKELKG